MFWFLIYLIHFFENYLGIRFGLIIVFLETLMRSAKLDVFRTFILYRSQVITKEKVAREEKTINSDKIHLQH